VPISNLLHRRIFGFEKLSNYIYFIVDMKEENNYIKEEENVSC